MASADFQQLRCFCANHPLPAITRAPGLPGSACPYPVDSGCLASPVPGSSPSRIASHHERAANPDPDTGSQHIDTHSLQASTGLRTDASRTPRGHDEGLYGMSIDRTASSSMIFVSAMRTRKFYNAFQTAVAGGHFHRAGRSRISIIGSGLPEVAFDRRNRASAWPSRHRKYLQACLRFLRHGAGNLSCQRQLSDLQEGGPRKR
ncbi:hypothetical protein P3T16_002303 [Paraburkholderia sp. GAS42]